MSAALTLTRPPPLESPADHPSTSISTSALRPHPLNAEVFVRAHEAEDEALLQDVRRNGILHPLLVCGERCASPRGTLLAGHRRWRAACALGLPTLQGLFVDDLTGDAEAERLLLDNRTDQRSRHIRHSELFAIEERLRAIHGKRQGQRSDLEERTCVIVTQVAPRRRRDANARLAELTGEKASAIRNRHTVFPSEIVSDAVREGIDAGRISLTRAATAVRRLMRDEHVSAAYEANDAAALAEAQRRLESELFSGATGKQPWWIAYARRALNDLQAGDPGQACEGLRRLLTDAGFGEPEPVRGGAL